jgi:hypothetical protein
MPREMNILALAKGAERYVFLYDDESTDELIDIFDRYATDADLSFTASDADILSQKVHESVRSLRWRKSLSPHEAT